MPASSHNPLLEVEGYGDVSLGRVGSLGLQ